MSFIEKEILAEKNPLCGRATGIYKMTERPFSDVIKFFPGYSPEDQITAYAVLGGIPHYIKQFDSNLSIEENIKKNILTKGSVLYSEVEFLLRQELRETAVYNTIIEAIALGNTVLNDIFNKTQIVEREFSVSDSVKERAKSNRGIYRLTDSFFRFWYSFVFEELCRDYIRLQNRQNKLPYRYAKIGRWWGKAAQFDLADYKALEAKWNSTDDTECCFYLFSQSGFTDAVNNLVTEGKAVCISMEQMVDEFSGEIL